LEGSVAINENNFPLELDMKVAVSTLARIQLGRRRETAARKLL
jgi:hypothetical protein